jgi:hypothetical protein
VDCKPQSEMDESSIIPHMMYVHGAKMLQNSCNMAFTHGLQTGVA